MTQDQITAYIAIFASLEQLGVAVVGGVKRLMEAFHPGQTLTEDEINAIEQGIVADAERRRAERESMGQAGDGQ